MHIGNVVYVKRKTNRTRQLLVIIPVALLVIIVAVAIISIFNGLSLIHPRHLAVSVKPPATLGGYQDASFKSSTGIDDLKGWFFRSAQNKGNVIIVHGYGQNRLQFGTETFNLIDSLVNGGYNVLAFDLRDSGESSGKNSSLGFYEKYDVLGAVDWVRQTSPGKTALLGYSTGASAAMLAAAENANINAVIADTPFSDLRLFVSRHLSKWSSLPTFPFSSTILLTVEVLCRMDASKVSPDKALKKLSPKPVLFIHSANDNSIPLNDNKPMYDSYINLAKGASAVWYTQSGGHAGSFPADEAGYSSKVISFLDAALAG